ncbi:MAG: prepilin-type N-terminal cleavage/methylation domain-containing protein [Methylobacter sp.]|nr:prepilin-type N-terminal cleavage/methylation domain-containing protein [Candidatus Methylobacter titanis]
MSPRGSQLKKRHHGFSLTELAVSLAILGVLVFALPPLIPQVRQMLSGQQSVGVQDASDALMGFIMVHNRLPCPDTGSDGLEDCGAANDIGLLPWRTVGLSGPMRNAYGLDFRYGVYRHSNVILKQDADLAVLANRFEPYLPPTVKVAVSHSTPPSPPNIYLPISGSMPQLPTTPAVLTGPNAEALANHSNGLDFCHALRNATQSAAGLTKVNAGLNAAFVVADPGAADKDQDGNLFDGVNSPLTQTFASPDIPLSDAYDDKVLVMGFAELAGALGCPVAVANVNAAARDAWAAYDEYRAAVFYAYLRDFMYIVRQTNVQINEFHFVFSTVGLAITAGQLATDLALAAGSFSGIGASVVIGVAIGIYSTVTAAQQLAAAETEKALLQKQLTAAWIQVQNAASREESMRLFAETQLTTAIASDNRGWFQ